MKAPSRLRCEYLENPIGLDVAEPRFSWRMESDARGARQTARQIQVATTAELLAADTGDGWDTGKVEDDQSLHIVYGGVALEPRRRYWWRVRIWDEKGEASAWSEPAFWETAFLSETQWDADWISIPERPGETRPVEDPVSEPCPFLRRQFDCARVPTRGRLYVTALGLYECRINGERVGDDCFTPGWTDYSIRFTYQTYDVTDMLRDGENVIGAILGDGWACGYLVHGNHHWGNQPFLKAMLILDYEDGGSETIRTDDSWRATTGPILASDIYHGETYDARLEMLGWDAPGFDDADWGTAWAGDSFGGRRSTFFAAAKEGRMDAKLCAKPGPHPRRMMELPVLEMTEPEAGVYRFDLGQVMAGRVCLRVTQPAGTTITIRGGQALNEDGSVYYDNLGSAKATDYYTCRGDGEEVYEPRFTYHGFRYVELYGCATRPDQEAVTGIVIHNNMEVLGHFCCSDERVNQLQSNIQWSQRANMIAVPTCCSERDERLGWTGDAQIFLPTGSYNMDVAGFFTHYCPDVEDAQTDEGAFTHVAPCVTGHGGSPAWADAGVICPWTIYRFFGDTRILERHYDAMGRWVAYQVEKGTDLICLETGAGDWLSPDHDCRDPFNSLGPPPRSMIGTAYLARCCDIMAKTAALLGKDKDVEHYSDLAERVRAAYRHEFVRPDGTMFCGAASGKSQTAFLLTLAFDMLEEWKRQDCFEWFVKLLEVQDWHLRTGFVGTPLLNPVLSRFGRTDIAYRLLLEDTFPSWLHMVKMGATTIWECWDGYLEDEGFAPAGMNSLNLYAKGCVGEWICSVVGGIALDPEVPAFKRFRIGPQPGAGIDGAEMRYESRYGEILCRWRKEAGVFAVETRIPPNTSALVVLPCGEGERVMVNGLEAERAEGASDVRQEDGNILFNAVAGEYQIEVGGR